MDKKQVKLFNSRKLSIKYDNCTLREYGHTTTIWRPSHILLSFSSEPPQNLIFMFLKCPNPRNLLSWWTRFTVVYLSISLVDWFTAVYLSIPLVDWFTAVYLSIPLVDWFTAVYLSIPLVDWFTAVYLEYPPGRLVYCGIPRVSPFANNEELSYSTSIIRHSQYNIFINSSTSLNSVRLTVCFVHLFLLIVSAFSS